MGLEGEPLVLLDVLLAAGPIGRQLFRGIIPMFVILI
jgi:hypothetical protein